MGGNLPAPSMALMEDLLQEISTGQMGGNSLAQSTVLMDNP